MTRRTATTVPMLTNPSTTGLAAALRHRLTGAGFTANITSKRPETLTCWGWDFNAAGERETSLRERTWSGYLTIEVHATSLVQAGEWVRANVAPAVLASTVVLVKTTEHDGRGQLLRVFGSLLDFVAAAIGEDEAGYAHVTADSETDRGSDWSYWHRHLTELERATLYAVARGWKPATHGSAASLLNLVTVAAAA